MNQYPSKEPKFWAIGTVSHQTMYVKSIFFANDLELFYLLKKCTVSGSFYCSIKHFRSNYYETIFDFRTTERFRIYKRVLT